MKVAIINGPNLNLLGNRETDIYGDMSFEDFLKQLKTKNPEVEISYIQSNVEGELIDAIQRFAQDYDGIILNAAAYTHTSIGIRDAIAAIQTDVIEVHISNTASRESFRHDSMITGVCKGLIMGFGLQSYEMALGSILSA